jgi:hypothetical protein
MMKTLMGIAAKNLTALDDESLMPDPVNAWTRPSADRDNRPLCGFPIPSQIALGTGTRKS